MTLPNTNSEAAPGSPEEARRDAEEYAGKAAEQEETATTVVQALNAHTLAMLSLGSRLGQLAAVLAADDKVVTVQPRSLLDGLTAALADIGERAR